MSINLTAMTSDKIITSMPVNESLENTTFLSYRDIELFESFGNFINPAYPLFLKKLGLNRVAIRAEGSTITDSNGKEYVDCIGGYGLFNLGHNHPKILHALIEQLGEKQLVTKPFITEIPVKLAESLSKITPGELSCSFICNSGSEAIDSAIKLARMYKGKKQIIAAENSFHGYTFGALSASGIPSFKRLFSPMVPDIMHVPFGDIEALKDSICEDTAAILLEPVQHEAGVCLPPDKYLQEVRDVCESKEILLIIDEVKTGLGKTGYMFICDYYKITPDILVLGKSLGGGLIPIGALIAKKALWKKFGLSFPMSASSFAGNILACRAALETIEVLQQDGLLDDCKKKGVFLIEALRQCISKYPTIIKNVNGIGLLIGVESFSSTKTLYLSKDLINQGVLAVPAFGNQSVLMIEPPIIISNDQIQKIIDALNISCKKIS